MFPCLLSFDHLSRFRFSGERGRECQKSFEFTEIRRVRSSEALILASTLELIFAGILFFFSLALLNENLSFIFLVENFERVSELSLNF